MYKIKFKTPIENVIVYNDFYYEFTKSAYSRLKKQYRKTDNQMIEIIGDYFHIENKKYKIKNKRKITDYEDGLKQDKLSDILMETIYKNSSLYFTERFANNDFYTKLAVARKLGEKIHLYTLNENVFNYIKGNYPDEIFNVKYNIFLGEMSVSNYKEISCDLKLSEIKNYKCLRPVIDKYYNLLYTLKGDKLDTFMLDVAEDNLKSILNKSLESVDIAYNKLFDIPDSVSSIDEHNLKLYNLYTKNKDTYSYEYYLKIGFMISGEGNLITGIYVYM